ncbi:hypothetical protein HGI81_04110 [Olsenella sp. KGMB02461]|nr:hypothetical protein [Olsenella sp. KGMB02461]
MIKLKDLEQMGNVTFGDAGDVTLQNIKEAITDLAQQNGVPVAFYTDDAKDGGLFGNTYTALVAYHPEHRNDYFNMAMLLTKQGNFGTVTVYAAGKSKQMNKFARSETAREMRRGQSMSYQIGNMISSGLMNMGKSKQKLQEEQAYYEIILNVIDAALN